MWLVLGGKVITFARCSANICNISRCTWIEQLSISSTASVFVNSSFDRSSSIYGKRTVELYSLKGYEFMHGLLRRLRIKSTRILNLYVLRFLSTISLTCQQTKNGVMCCLAAEMQTTTDMCFWFLRVPWQIVCHLIADGTITFPSVWSSHSLIPISSRSNSSSVHAL
jgi:hypothetical protein